MEAQPLSPPYYQPPKIHTKPLRTITGLSARAGGIAKLHDTPWWAAWGYAASMVGSSEATELQQHAIEWLQGYLQQWRLDNPDKSPPNALLWLIRNGTNPF